LGQPIGGDGLVVTALGGAGPKPAFLAGVQAALAHQATDPVGAAAHLLAPQAVADPSTAVRPAALEEEQTDLLG
jgi:hypothetical protein